MPKHNSIKFRGVTSHRHKTPNKTVYGDFIHLDNGKVAIKPLGEEPIEVCEDSVVQLVGYAHRKTNLTPIGENDELVEVYENDTAVYFTLDGELKLVRACIIMRTFEEKLPNTFLTEQTTLF